MLNRPTRPALLRRVALIVIAWAISEPLLLDHPGSTLAAVALGLALSVPLLAARRAPAVAATVVTGAYLVQRVTGERAEVAMSPELALAFALFCAAAYANAEASVRSWRVFVAVPIACAGPAGLAIASALDLGVVRDLSTFQYLYVGAVASAGLLPGLALRSRHREVDALQAEVEALYAEAAVHIGQAVTGERRQLGSQLTRVVSGLVRDIEGLVADARTTFTSAPAEAATLGRRMAAAAGEAGDELRALLGTLTAEPAQADPRATRRRPDPRALAGLAFPVVGLALLAVADRMGLPNLPATFTVVDGGPPRPLTIPASQVGPVAGYALAILTPVGLLWRRRAPVLAVGSVGALLVLRMALAELTSLTISQVFTCGVLAYMAGAWPRTLPRALAAGALALAATLACWLLEQYHFTFVPYAYMVGVLVGAWAVGRAIRHDLRAALALRDRARVLRAQRDRLCALAIDGERRDVAREMHDVVGHGLSLIIVQAGVVDVLAPRDPARALDALRVVESAARSTQVELGALQAALSAETRVIEPEARDASTGPASWSAAIDRIVEDARAVGQPVIAWVDPRLDDIDPAVGAALTRIAQEALTNVRKHASGAATTLELTVRGERVELTVSNPTGRRLPGAPAGSGLGIAGMIDRAAALRGTVQAGPGDDGGWTVRARLPARRVLSA